VGQWVTELVGSASWVSKLMGKWVAKLVGQWVAKLVGLWVARLALGGRHGWLSR
jgi:hypothetical protein